MTVRAINGAGRGELSNSITVRTDAGVFPPNITQISTNQDENTYILRIDGFEDNFGPLRLDCLSLLDK